MSLDISYSGIREIPPELEQLKKLRYLSITNSLIEGMPDIVKRMTWLQSVNLGSIPLGISWEDISDEKEL
ncbi:Leucine Rich repeats (2 copies) [compost metagenome]